MRLSHNLIAGLVNSFWSALITFAVVPAYLKYLGAESYGLIGFFTTTQALVVLLDLGLASAINREIARSKSTEELKEAAKLLHTLAILYWGIAALIFIIVIMLSPLVADYWLQSKHLSTNTVSHAVMLIGIVLACRWPIALYQGVLVGAQRLLLQSNINIIMVTLSNLGAVAVLAFLSPTIEAYFIWQAIVGIFYVFTIRVTAWKVVGKPNNLKFDIAKLKRVWRFSLGMSGIGLTSLAFTQLDKVILSKMLSLEDFGHYMLATLLVSGLYLLISPVYNVIYPRFSALVALDSKDSLTDLYCTGARLFTSIFFPVAMILAVFSESILQVWTGSSEIAAITAPVVSFLAIGSGLHGVMYFPYAMQLAYGLPKVALKNNLILMIALGPLIVFLTLSYGMLGSALAWLAVQILHVILGSWLTHQYLLHNLMKAWLINSVLIPLLISTVIGTVSYFYFKVSTYDYYVQALLAGTMLIVSFSLSVLTSLRLRLFIKRHVLPSTFNRELTH